MRKLSYYEQVFRDQRSAVGSSGGLPDTPASLTVDEIRVDDPEVSVVVEEAQADLTSETDASAAEEGEDTNSPAGETKAQRRARRKAERAKAVGG